MFFSVLIYLRQLCVSVFSASDPVPSLSSHLRTPSPHLNSEGRRTFRKKIKLYPPPSHNQSTSLPQEDCHLLQLLFPPHSSLRGLFSRTELGAPYQRFLDPRHASSALRPTPCMSLPSGQPSSSAQTPSASPPEQVAATLRSALPSNTSFLLRRHQPPSAPSASSHSLVTFNNNNLSDPGRSESKPSDNPLGSHCNRVRFEAASPHNIHPHPNGSAFPRSASAQRVPVAVAVPVVPHLVHRTPYHPLAAVAGLHSGAPGVPFGGYSSPYNVSDSQREKT